MVKNISFIEKKNKPLFEIELLMEYLVDDVYDKVIDYYKNNNINDIILIDKRLDIWRTRLIGCHYLENEDLDTKNKFIYSFNKKTFYVNFGFLYKSFNEYLYIKGKNSSYKINRNESYIFYKNIKSKKQRENDSVRDLLTNILNNKIKIKKYNQ